MRELRAERFGRTNFGGIGCVTFFGRHGVSSFRNVRRVRQGFAVKLDQRRGDLCNRQNIIDRNMLDRASWHAGIQRFLRILRNHGPAKPLDDHRPGGAVVEVAGKDHRRHAPAE